MYSIEYIMLSISLSSILAISKNVSNILLIFCEEPNIESVFFVISFVDTYKFIISDFIFSNNSFCIKSRLSINLVFFLNFKSLISTINLNISPRFSTDLTVSLLNALTVFILSNTAGNSLRI